MTRVTIEEWPEPIEAAKGSLLDAALKAGVPYPHGCRTGECGACKSRLISGQVKHDPCDPHALTAEEKKAGLILACRARAKTDVVVSWQGAEDVVPPTRLRARIESVERAAADVMIVRLQPETPFSFKAGQFANLSFDRCPSRSYSMANHPQADRLEFHIRLVPGGQVSSHLTSRATVGDEVGIEGPFGAAYLREDPERPLVAIASGTGLAPIRSIVDQALSIGWRNRIQVWAGFRSADHAYGHELLEAWRARGIEVRICLDEAPGQDGAGPLRSRFSDHAEIEPAAALYVCGSPGMVDAIKSTIIAKGGCPNSIFADAFVAAAPSLQPTPGVREQLGSWFGKWRSARPKAA